MSYAYILSDAVPLASITPKVVLLTSNATNEVHLDSTMPTAVPLASNVPEVVFMRDPKMISLSRITLCLYYNWATSKLRMFTFIEKPEGIYRRRAIIFWCSRFNPFTLTTYMNGRALTWLDVPLRNRIFAKDAVQGMCPTFGIGYFLFCDTASHDRPEILVLW